MNIPFPIIYPQLITPDWFHADQPCDDDAELTKLEQANQQWLNSIAKKYMKHVPTGGKPNPEPIEDTGSDDDATDDVEESEESPDVDEEEEISSTESPPIIHDVDSESPEENTEATDLEVEIQVLPRTDQNE